jgi:signal transduction histidine kinase
MLWLRNLFSTADLTPHGFCLLWRPGLLWLQVVPDALIGLSYYSIPLALAYFVSKRRDIAFGWIFWMFAVFILGCGTTHFVEIWTLWYPDYLTQGLVKVATAAISVATAMILWPIIPHLLALPSPAQLRDANKALLAEIAERNRVVDALQREIINHQRTEEILRQSQKMEGLGQLTGGVAHDFNNVLLILRGQLHILKRRGLVPGDDAHVAAVERAIARGEGLTRQLLSFARWQTLDPSVIDLNDEMPKMLDLLRRSLRADIEIRLDMTPSVWPIEVDQNEFELALINIAANARDAMRRGGVLNIAIANETLHSDDPALQSLSGDVVSISLSDSGEGISPETIDRIFEPFFTTKQQGKGTGLGLSQVYEFARQSGGDSDRSEHARPRDHNYIIPAPFREPASCEPESGQRPFYRRDGRNSANRGGQPRDRPDEVGPSTGIRVSYQARGGWRAGTIDRHERRNHSSRLLRYCDAWKAQWNCSCPDVA